MTTKKSRNYILIGLVGAILASFVNGVFIKIDPDPQGLFLNLLRELLRFVTLIFLCVFIYGVFRLMARLISKLFKSS